MAQRERLLVRELEFYDRNRDRFLREHDGRYLLIEGSRLIGSFETEDQAVGEGVRRFGAGPFLVRQAGANTPDASVPSLSLGLLCRS